MTAGTIGYVQLSQFLVVYGGILPLTIKYVLEESYDKKVEYGKHKKQFYTPALFSHSIPLKRRLRLCSQTP